MLTFVTLAMKGKREISVPAGPVVGFSFRTRGDAPKPPKTFCTTCAATLVRGIPPRQISPVLGRAVGGLPRVSGS